MLCVVAPVDRVTLFIGQPYPLSFRVKGIFRGDLMIKQLGSVVIEDGYDFIPLVDLSLYNLIKFADRFGPFCFYLCNAEIPADRSEMIPRPDRFVDLPSRPVWQRDESFEFF